MQSYKKIILMLLCLISTNMFSKNNVEELPKQAVVYTIKGLVVDSVGNSVAYPTISLKRDSATLAYSDRYSGLDNGKFEIKYTSADDTVFVNIGAAAKMSENITLSLGANTVIDLGKVMLKDGNELAGVAVVAYKPLVTQNLDRINYDVEADPESKTNTVMEMLRKVPLVTVDNDENIQVKGSSSFKIYVNGKPSNMVTKNPKEIFKSMPATSIKRIEVITDPGAKYDAEGISAILNVVTQSALQGYQGSVRLGASTRGEMSVGSYISTKVGKLGVSGRYSYRQYKGLPYLSESTSENYSEATPYKYSYTKSEGRYINISNYGSVEISYEFDTLNLMSVSFGMASDNRKSESRSNKLFFDKNKNVVSAYNTSSLSGGNEISYYGSIDYQRSFAKPDQLLTVSYNFDVVPNEPITFSTLEVDSAYSNALNIKPKNLRYRNSNRSDEHTFQIDYTEPFDNNKHIVEGGVKYILRYNASDNEYRRHNPITGKYDLVELDDNGNPRLENDMEHYQHILGGYASYSFKLKNFSLRIGGRFEGTYQDVRFVDIPKNNFKLPFFDLIPSISTNWKPSSSSSIRFGYSNGISRPGIWYLNPYVDDSNPYHISYGNPNLKSERSHSFSLSYGLFSSKFNMNISSYTSIVNNSIERQTTVDDKGIVHSTYANIGRYNSFGGHLYINYNPWKWLRFWGQSSVGYSLYLNENRASAGITINGYGGINMLLPWKMRFSINAGGSPKYYSYQIQSNGWYYYGCSLSRNFLKGDKLSVSISGNNFLRKYRIYRTKSWVDGVYESTSISRSISRSVSLSVSWRFGEMKAEIKKIERGISNDDKKSGSSGDAGGGN